MQIGELATRSGVSTRMLRHYDKQGLLAPSGRDANGYRTYDESQVATARRIAELLAAGLPSRLVGDLLEVTTDAGGIYPEHVDPGTVETVEQEWRRMCRCVDCMAGRRDAIKTYLDGLRAGQGQV